MNAAIDLTWLQQVKDFAEVTSSKDDAIISALITAFSQWALTYCSRETLSAVQTFTEVYDGNNSVELFLRNSPIQSIVSVNLGSMALPISTGFPAGGVFIGQLQRSILVRIGANAGSFSSNFYPSGGGGYVFSKGKGNIQVVYTAGYPPQTAQNEIETIAANTIPLAYPTWVSDGGVVYYPSLVPLVKVASSPAAGQYAVSNGLYVFNNADNGNQVAVTYNYNSAPSDLEFAARRTVGVFYKRRQWLDQASKSLSMGQGATGTTRYRDWPLTPEDRITLNNYKRFAIT